MARVDFSLQVRIPAAAAVTWAALTSWASHGEWIPMTRMTVLSGDGGLGTRFVARTGLGPLALDDVMVVTQLDSEQRAASVEKVGHITGTAAFSVTPHESGESVVQWSESVQVPGLPRFLTPLVAGIGAVAFRLSLQRLARHLARRHP